MTQLITIPKSIYSQLLDRVARLEKIVFKNSKITHSISTYIDEKNKGKLKKLKKIDELFK